MDCRGVVFCSPFLLYTVDHFEKSHMANKMESDDIINDKETNPKDNGQQGKTKAMEKVRAGKESVEERVKMNEKKGEMAGEKTDCHSGSRSESQKEGEKDKEKEINYEKDLTVQVELKGEEVVTPIELIRVVRLMCGNICACRSTGPNKYEITMGSAAGKRKLMDGFKIGNTMVTGKEINNDELVVSFLGLPAYIGDEEILEKLELWCVSAMSPIKRRMWPGTRVADGTRFVKVRFNEEVQSLPYSAKFNTAGGTEFFRVIHDRQVRVCRLCIQPGHIVRECPEFLCNRCGVQGHYARECTKRISKCKVCYNKTENCICGQESEGSMEVEERDDESVMEESDGQEGESEIEEVEEGLGDRPVAFPATEGEPSADSALERVRGAPKMGPASDPGADEGNSTPREGSAGISAATAVDGGERVPARRLSQRRQELALGSNMDDLSLDAGSQIGAAPQMSQTACRTSAFLLAEKAKAREANATSASALLGRRGLSPDSDLEREAGKKLGRKKGKKK